MARACSRGPRGLPDLRQPPKLLGKQPGLGEMPLSWGRGCGIVCCGHRAFVFWSSKAIILHSAASINVVRPALSLPQLWIYLCAWFREK